VAASKMMHFVTYCIETTTVEERVTSPETIPTEVC